MEDDIRRCVIRILKPSGSTAGSGFLAAPGLAVTCAHVVRFALGRKDEDPDPTGGEQVGVEFFGGQAGTAEVLARGWLPHTGGDLAFLRLAETPPGLPLARLAGSTRSGGQEYACFGYPNDTGDAKGAYDRDHILGRLDTACGYERLSLAGRYIRRGFSGAPVWDTRLERVVGMVTWGQEMPHGVAALAVTSENIHAQWPDLPLDDPDALPGGQETEKAIQFAVPRSIPAPVATFTGREIEIETLLAEIACGRGAAITGISGMGGAGKSQLAFKLAELLKDRYPGGGFYLDLRGMTDPLPLAGVVQAILRAFAPPAAAARLPDGLDELVGLYRSLLDGRRALLLLDNARDAAQVAPLLPPPPGCLALVTSRSRVSLPGMVEWPLDSLPEADAVTLLRAIAPRIGEYAPPLARACGCLPLALDVIARLLRRPDQAPARLLAEMEDGVKRLKRTAVEASLGLSYAALPPALQEKWRRLGVFAGDFGLEAVPWVWGTITPQTTSEEAALALEEAAESLGALLETSLVSALADGARYRLHDLARVYAAGRMQQAEETAARLAHAGYYCALLAQADEQYLQGGEHILPALAVFDRERGEIQAARAWCAAGGEDERARLELAGAFPDAGTYLIDLRMHPREQIRWREDGLRAAQALTRRSLESAHLGSLGNAYWSLGEPRKAIQYHEQDLAIAREIGDRRGEGAALGNLGVAYKNLGEPRKAIQYYEQHLAIARAIGDRQGEGNALGSLGNAYDILGEPRKAIAYYEQWLAIARAIGDRQGEANACWNLGLALEEAGDLPRAAQLMQVRVDFLRAIGHPDAEKDAAYVEQVGAKAGGGGAKRERVLRWRWLRERLLRWRSQ